MYAALRAGVIAAGEALLAPRVTRQLITEFVRRPEGDQLAPPTR